MKYRILLALFLALIGLILFLNLRRKDWRGPESIQISYRMMPAPGPGAVAAVTFLFEREWALTSVRLIARADASNPSPATLWDLVGEKKSSPVTFLHYGAPLPGMRSRYPGDAPKPLKPGVKYRLLVESGDLRGERDFTYQPVLPPG